MDLSKMSDTEARATVMRAMEVFSSSLQNQQRSSPKEIQELPLDLSTARTRSQAMQVSFPFKSLLVEQATDLNTYIYVLPIDNDTGNGALRMGLKDVYKNEFGFRECYIWWDAQANKSMILKFFVTSFVENGRLLLDQNSQYNDFRLGIANSPNDGFTILQKYSLSVVSTATNSGISIMPSPVAINDNTNNLGTVSVTGSPLGGFFVVPTGYTAEVVGARIDIQTTFGTSGFEIDILELTQGTNYDYIDFATSGVIASVVRGFTLAAGADKSALVELPFSNSSAVPRTGFNKNIFLEGKIIAVTTLNFSTTITGSGELRLMIKLTKNVG